MDDPLLSQGLVLNNDPQWIISLFNTIPSEFTWKSFYKKERYLKIKDMILKFGHPDSIRYIYYS